MRCAMLAPIIVSLIQTPAAVKPIAPPKSLPARPAAKPMPQRIIEPVPLPDIAVPTPSTFATLVPDAAVPAPEVPQAPLSDAPMPVVPPSFNAAYLDNPAPVYPPLARRSGEQGRVVLRVHVTASGAAENGRTAHQQRLAAPRSGGDRDREAMALRARAPGRPARRSVGPHPDQLSRSSAESPPITRPLHVFPATQPEAR